MKTKYFRGGLYNQSLKVLLFIGLLAGLQAALIIPAQASTPAGSSTCISCHEEQYYLYDTGRWYCVTEAQTRCVNCHAGYESSLDKQEAHTGLISNPLRDGGKNCQACHGQDSEAYIQKVVAHTGYHVPIQVEFEPAPVSALSAWPLAEKAQPPFWLIPAAVALFTLWFWLVIRTSRA